MGTWFFCPQCHRSIHRGSPHECTGGGSWQTCPGCGASFHTSLGHTC